MIVLLVKTPTRANPPNFSASSLATIVSAIIHVLARTLRGYMIVLLVKTPTRAKKHNTAKQGRCGDI
jgi:hypothetical protein